MTASADRPLVSIVIPTRNRRESLSDAIESLLAQRLQGELDVVVVDNACDDGTAEMIQTRFPQIRHIRQPVMVGAQQNMMAALRAGTGRYVGMLFDDEVMLHDNLWRKIEILEQQSGVVGVASSVTKREVDGSVSPGRALRSQCVIEGRVEYLTNSLGTFTAELSTLVMRTDAVGEMQMRPQDQPIDDSPFFYRLSKLGSIATIPDGLVTHTTSAVGQMYGECVLEPVQPHDRRRPPLGLPTVWFYWSYRRVSLDHLAESDDLSKVVVGRLRRKAQAKWRSGVWKAAYCRLLVTRRPGPSFEVMLQAFALDPFVIVPPVVSLVRKQSGLRRAPIAPFVSTSQQERTA